MKYLKDILEKGIRLEGGTDAGGVYQLEGRVYKIQPKDIIDLDFAIPLLNKVKGSTNSHVVNIFDYWLEDDQLVIEMESLTPITLPSISMYDLDTIYMDSEDTLKGLETALTVIKDSFLVDIFTQVYKGMLELGVDRYDINLDNALYDNKGNVKIIDFL